MPELNLGPVEAEPVILPHFLVVEDEWDEYGGLELEHHDDCPTEQRDGYVAYICVPGMMVSDNGLDIDFAHCDDPDPFYRAERLPPGRYEVEPWFETYPGGPWGSTEYDAGLRRVADVAIECPELPGRRHG